MDSMQRQGLRIYCQYVVFSVEEFVLRFKYPPEALGVPTVEIPNEYSEIERCVLLRDTSVPRMAHLFTDTTYDLREASMSMYVRPGQTRDTFTHLVAEVNSGLRVTPAFSDRDKFLTLAAADHKARLETEKRQAAENRDEVSAAVADNEKAQTVHSSESLVCRPAWMQQQQQQQTIKEKDTRRRQTVVAKGAQPAAPGNPPRAVAASSASGPASVVAKRLAPPAQEEVEVAEGGLVDCTRPAKRIRGKTGGSQVSASSAAITTLTSTPGEKRAPYFDITGILTGTVRGQAVAGAQRTLKTLVGPQHTKKRQSLQQELVVAESAYKCSPAKIDELSLPQLQQHLSIIAQHHPPGIPLITEAVHLKKYIDSTVHLRNFHAVFDAIRPWRLPGDRPNSLKPSISQAISKMDKGSADHATYLAAALQDGFFGDSFAALLSEPSTDDDAQDPPSVAHDFCRGILELYLAQEGSVDLAELPDFVIDPIDEVIVFCKSVVMVAKPSFTTLGCKHDDANHIFNPDSRVALRNGTRSALIAIDTSLAWKALLSDFWDHYVAEVAAAEKYIEYLGVLETKPDFRQKKAHDLVHELTQVLPTWAANLRAGATTELEEALQAYMQENIVPGLSDTDPGHMQVACKLIGSIVAALDPDDENKSLQKVRAKVVDKMREADDVAATSAVYMAATSWTKSSDSTEDLQMQLDRAKNAPLNADAVTALRDLRGFVQKAMVEASVEQVWCSPPSCGGHEGFICRWKDFSACSGLLT